MNVRPRFVALTLVLAAAACGWWVFGVVSPPRLVVSTTIDVGKVFPGQIVERAIPIKNAGRGTLHIGSIKACCGSVVADDYPRMIAPGETGFALVRLTTATSGVGAFTSRIAVSSNDSHSPSMVELSGWYDGPIIAVPASVRLGYITPGLRIGNASTIRLKEPEPINVITSSPYVQVEKRTGTEPGQFFLDLAIAKNVPRGKLASYILLVRDKHPETPLVLPVYGTIERGIQATAAGSSTKTVDLRILDKSWSNLQIHPSADSSLSAKLMPTGPMQYALQVTVECSDQHKSSRSVVRLRSSNGDCVDFPIMVFYQRPKETPLD